jgi:hypothetical protein
MGVPTVELLLPSHVRPNLCASTTMLTLSLVNGKSVQLTVEGECPICIASGIDITEAAYTALGASVRGPPTVNWQFD